MYNKYFPLEKVKSLISMYIKLTEYDDYFDDYEASLTLQNIFSVEELEALGISEYVRKNIGLTTEEWNMKYNRKELLF